MPQASTDEGCGQSLGSTMQEAGCPKSTLIAWTDLRTCNDNVGGEDMDTLGGVRTREWSRRKQIGGGSGG